jgi:hypothetical protein
MAKYGKRSSTTVKTHAAISKVEQLRKNWAILNYSRY